MEFQVFHNLLDDDSEMLPEYNRCAGHLAAHHDADGCLIGRLLPDVGRGHIVHLQSVPICLPLGGLTGVSSK